VTGGGHRAGFVALTGRPNVGKSTLLNRILGRKLAIVTPKPQTTRNRILGILTRPQAQYLFVDTPGLHRPKNLLGERMVKVATQTSADADVVLWIVDAETGLEAGDDEVVRRLASERRPFVLALNKIDRVNKGDLLPLAQRLSEFAPGTHVVPISAKSGENVEELLTTLATHLPESPLLYPADTQTDLPERFFAGEMIREQILLATHEEVPYQCAVHVEQFIEREGRNLVVIGGTILVARKSQKAIVIGERGARLKEIGSRARRELEAFFGVRVYLELFVKVDPKWFEKAGALMELGL
jgi:GTP-binding protein Era